MVKTEQEAWQQLVADQSSEVLSEVMQRSVDALSMMANIPFRSERIWVDRMSITEANDRIGTPESESVGVFLRMEGGAYGQALLVFPLKSALALADAVEGLPAGTTQDFDQFMVSVMAELGNMMFTYFLNAMTNVVEEPVLLRPSPPAVAVDMIGAILDTVMSPLFETEDAPTVIGTDFKEDTQRVKGQLWLFPDLETRM